MPADERVWHVQDSAPGSASLSHKSIAIPGGHCGAALWGAECAAVLQPSGTLSAVRLSKPSQPCEIVQCSSGCVIRSLPASAPGKTASLQEALRAVLTWMNQTYTSFL